MIWPIAEISLDIKLFNVHLCISSAKPNTGARSGSEVVKITTEKPEIVVVQRILCESTLLLKCKKCKAVACRGSDIYVVDKTCHHVVPGNVLHYEIREHETPGRRSRVCEYDGSIIKKSHKVHCSNCGTSWDALGYWPKSKHKFPILKCCSFNFFMNGVQNNFKQWKKRPFDALPLSNWFTQNKSED